VLPIPFDRTYLDRAAQPRRRNPWRDLDRGIEIVSLEEVVAADGSLGVDERPFCDLSLAVLDAYGGRTLRKPHRAARRDAWGLIYRGVLGDERLFLFGRPIRNFRPRGPLVDEQHVLHLPSLWSVVSLSGAGP